MTDVMERPYFYDRQGRVIDVETLTRLGADDDYRHVAVSDVVDPAGREAHVSTVWLGVDASHAPDGEPLIFQTLAFVGGHLAGSWQHATEADALAAHDGVVAALREGREP